ncbi:MAG: type I-E CRISPR-associated protein Cas7/Cse4/CasC [Hyphomicrobiales bacterium]|nr:type I-E CRISPR-associated protein Cas7/Cse4/CasC [Hyphomicrobiales bacterium]
MTDMRFLQIHWLTSYPATLLNRDDSGLAKRLPFGGVVRTRVSSQCLKRHWRTVEDEWALKNIGLEMAVRSRETPERRILPALEQAQAGSEDIRNATVLALAIQLYGDKAEDKSKRQALLLGEPEIAYLAGKSIEIAKTATDAKGAAEAMKKLFKEEKGNLAALRKNGVLEAGLEAALFGRMVTSDPEANTDAAIHVAHAFTVHEEASESDYFTVVDDLAQEAGETGAGGIFDTELTAGLFYGYVVVDIPALIANVGGDAALAGRICEHLIHLIATVSPGAKKGSTAPYAVAQTMLVEAGRRQPRTLADAFRAPSEALIADADRALAEHLRKIDAAYGAKEERRFLSIEGADLSGATRTDLDGLGVFARDAAVAKSGS